MGGSPWGATPQPKLLDDLERAAQSVKRVGGESIVFRCAFPKARSLPADTWQKLAEFMNEIGRV